LPALPELSVPREKQHVVVRTAQRFLSERRMEGCPYRFDNVPLIIGPDSRRWCGCTKMPSALECRGHEGNFFTTAEVAVQFVAIAGLPL
jgi:hypothetical protein